MERIFRTITDFGLIAPGMGILAGVSGGADSVCLLLALCRFRQIRPFSLRVVHVEHGIRGRESLEDAEFTADLCRKLDVPCEVVSADVPKYASDHRLSLEEAARELRYRIFREQKERWGLDRIAVAHNRDDQAETVLMNLARGTGLKGMQGMRPLNGEIIRPLLFTPRAEIEQILLGLGQAWRTDSTNLSTDMTRNRVRRELLPWMEKNLNQAAAAHVSQAARQVQEAWEYLERQVRREAEVLVNKTEEGAFLRLSENDEKDPFLLKELVRHALEDAGCPLKDIGRVHVEQILSLKDRQAGKQICLPGNVLAVRTEEGICIRTQLQPADEEKQKDTAVYPLLPGRAVQAGGYLVTCEICENAALPRPEILNEKKYTKYLACDTINHVCLRTRRPGDYLVVNREEGRKKLKDYLIDRKVPAAMRDDLLLVAEGPHVLWVIGHRISEAAKVSNDVRTVLKVTVLSQEGKQV